MTFEMPGIFSFASFHSIMFRTVLLQNPFIEHCLKIVFICAGVCMFSSVYSDVSVISNCGKLQSSN